MIRYLISAPNEAQDDNLQEVRGVHTNKCTRDAFMVTKLLITKPMQSVRYESRPLAARKHNYGCGDLTGSAVSAHNPSCDHAYDYGYDHERLEAKRLMCTHITYMKESGIPGNNATDTYI